MRRIAEDARRRRVKRWLAIAAVAAAALAFAPGARGADDALQAVLDRTGAQVSQFLEVISDVNCTERVTQAKLDGSEKIVEKQETSFDYLILLSNEGGDLNLVESRIASGKAPAKQKSPLLVSNGFSTLFLIFHPYYSPAFEFRADGEETLGDRTYMKVAFRHIRGMKSPAALAVRGREYPLDLAGTAWIDPQTGTIAKIEAELESGMEDVGLRSLQSEIDYAPVAFPASGQAVWLPAKAIVDVESIHQHWRNTHVFTGYKRFSVSTKEEIKKP